MATSINPQYPSNTTDAWLPDTLVGGSPENIVTDGTMTLIAGQNLSRGALLGKITGSGKLTLSLSAAGDGSQNPYAILAENCNAVTDSICAVYLAGEFDPNVMTFGTGQTAALTKDALRVLGIFLKTFVSR